MSTKPYDLRTVNYSTVIPAIPGTTIIHYNGYHDSTQEEAVVFWGVGVEDEDANAFPCVKPFVLNLHGGFASPIDFVEGGHDGRESEIIGFNIPGWGFMSHCKTSGVYGEYLRQVKGYDPTLGEPNSLEFPVEKYTEHSQHFDINLPVAKEEPPIFVPPGWILTGNVPGAPAETPSSSLVLPNGESVPLASPETSHVIPLDRDGGPTREWLRKHYDEACELVHKVGRGEVDSLLRQERDKLKAALHVPLAGLSRDQWKKAANDLEKHNDTLNKLLLDAQNDAHAYRNQRDRNRGFLLRAITLLKLTQDQSIHANGGNDEPINALLKEWEEG